MTEQLYIVDMYHIRCYDWKSDGDNNVSPSYIIYMRRFRQCVEVHASRVAVLTDKAGRRIVKGARAEEKYFLMSILSGCAVKSCMSVTGKMNDCDIV